MRELNFSTFLSVHLTPKILRTQTPTQTHAHIQFMSELTPKKIVSAKTWAEPLCVCVCGTCIDFQTDYIICLNIYIYIYISTFWNGIMWNQSCDHCFNMIELNPSDWESRRVEEAQIENILNENYTTFVQNMNLYFRISIDPLHKSFHLSVSMCGDACFWYSKLWQHKKKSHHFIKAWKFSHISEKAVINNLCKIRQN